MAGSPADRFWAYSLALYDRAGVAPACLSLQDRRGLDVNLLLFCCWAASEGRALSEPALRSAIAATAPWQEAVVQPLRALRRRLKAGIAAMPGARTEALRRRVGAVELEAERLEQHLLAADLRAPGEAAEPAAAARTARAHLQLYLRLAGILPEPADRADLSTLLKGAFPAAAPADLSFDVCA